MFWMEPKMSKIANLLAWDEEDRDDAWDQEDEAWSRRSCGVDSRDRDEDDDKNDDERGGRS